MYIVNGGIVLFINILAFNEIRTKLKDMVL